MLGKRICIVCSLYFIKPWWWTGISLILGVWSLCGKWNASQPQVMMITPPTFIKVIWLCLYLLRTAYDLSISPSLTITVLANNLTYFDIAFFIIKCSNKQTLVEPSDNWDYLNNDLEHKLWKGLKVTQCVSMKSLIKFKDFLYAWLWNKDILMILKSMFYLCT